MSNNLSKHLFKDKAVLIIKKIADYRDLLYLPERAIIERAGEKRILEFSTGRLCANQALLEHGINDFPVLTGEQREPLWPVNYVGSISHCKDLAGAVVARKDDIKSIGFDIENRKHLNPGIARHICTNEEKNWLDAQDPALQNLALLCIFSLKEAVFKCVYQGDAQQLRFADCIVRLDMQNKLSNALIQITHMKFLPGELEAHIHVTSNHVYSSVLWHHLPAVG